MNPIQKKRAVILILLANVLAVAYVVINFRLTGETGLGESGLLTKLSALQLVAVSVLAFGIFRFRIQEEGGSWLDRKESYLLWGLIGFGFFFLAADELFKIHENIDELVHSAFRLEETGWTDRIDDLLVLAYGVIGLIVIYFYRREFTLMKCALRYFLCGFFLLFMTVVLDVLTNRDDILTGIFDQAVAASLFTVLSFAEEAAKVFSEAFFVIAFYIALQTAKYTLSNTSKSDESG